MIRKNIQITISWNDYILLIKNILPTENFSVGESEDCNFILPIEKTIIIENGYLLSKSQRKI